MAEETQEQKKANVGLVKALMEVEDQYAGESRQIKAVQIVHGAGSEWNYRVHFRGDDDWEGGVVSQ